MNSLVTETFESIEAYLPKLIEAHHKLIQYCREENSIKAFELFPAYSKGLEWVLEAVMLINKQTIYFHVNMDLINSCLTEINDGINNEDLVLVADILEYEFSPILNEILTITEG
ncbi:hypothetical protein L1N85_23885 [Paenibacillus alkaliterrae]|uniref:hypothetical protein n=1 Tax=Paenibacillus alkaliterrae TaxID=320909 RepID=UPI001F2121ED|nr:hypothetical protein [Paenibacillus alkaliterrae]MCF2941392.1 hypothetical protein [Paenibacillus alkaliterrae]